MKLPPEQQAIRDKCYHPSGTFVDFPIEEVETSVPKRFEKIVRMHPDRLAVKRENRKLTYAELNAQANRIARKIVFHREISPAPVAILLEKDLGAVAATIGAFKSGEIHVALDPSYPEDRLGTILNDAGCKFIITNNRYFSVAEKLLKGRAGIMSLDELDERVSGENLSLQIGPDCPANIIYTSGSTGQPKGVLHSHRHALYYAMVYTRSHHTSTEDRVSCLYPIGVAGIMRDLLQALLNGASICLYDVSARGFDGLASWITDERVTIYRSVPTVFRNFVRTLSGRESFQHVRVVHLAGEHVRRTDVELWRKHFSSKCIFVTGLGLTEAGKVTDYFIDRESLIIDSTVSAGYPVDGMEVFIVGHDNLSSTRRTIGEVAVRSSYLPPGYWQRPELSATKYFYDSSGARVYLTGDVGCMLPDGSIQLFGRADVQSKVNGFRVDVSEVEIALLEIDVVRNAVVTVKGSGTEHERLVAYIVAHTVPAPPVRSLRQALVNKLPAFMIPSSFVLLE